jgi:hypothetical protein
MSLILEAVPPAYAAQPLPLPQNDVQLNVETLDKEKFRKALKKKLGPGNEKKIEAILNGKNKTLLYNVIDQELAVGNVSSQLNDQSSEVCLTRHFDTIYFWRFPTFFEALCWFLKAKTLLFIKICKRKVL